MHNKSLLPLARKLRCQQTSTEEKLWQALRGRQLQGLKFRRQQLINGYVADFCCLDLKLTVEIDGKQHNERAEYDRLRTEEIARAGFSEIRFTNDEVNERFDWVILEILRIADLCLGLEPREAFPRRE